MADRFKTIGIDRSENGRRYYKNVIYPEIPETEDDIYVISTSGDRYDTLARTYYGSTRDWWIIAIANTNQRASLIPTPGTQVRIPADPDSARREFVRLNRNR